MTLDVLTAMRINHRLIIRLEDVKPAIRDALRWMDGCLRPFALVPTYELNPAESVSEMTGFITFLSNGQRSGRRHRSEDGACLTGFAAVRRCADEFWSDEAGDASGRSRRACWPRPEPSRLHSNAVVYFDAVRRHGSIARRRASSIWRPRGQSADPKLSRISACRCSSGCRAAYG